MVLAVNKHHPLAGKAIPLAEAAAENFITLPSDTHNYQFFIRQCKKSGFTPKIILQTSDYYTIRQLIESNIGISFVPRYSWGFSENDISFVKILSPSCRNNIQILQVNQSPTPACEKFWRFVNHYQFIPKQYKAQEIETQP